MVRHEPWFEAFGFPVTHGLSLIGVVSDNDIRIVFAVYQNLPRSRYTENRIRIRIRCNI